MGTPPPQWPYSVSHYQQSVAALEMGHVLGLDHTSYQYSIMCPSRGTSYPRFVYTVQKDDNGAFLIKHPY